MRNLLIFAFIVFDLGNSFAQTKDYSNYFDQILKIEESTSNENFNQSLELYEALFENYKIVFARDAFNACQISSLQKSEKFDSFFYLCSKSGVGGKTLLSNNLISTRYKTNSSMFDSLIENGESEFYSRINISLRNEFKKRYQDEQKSKGTSSYKSICYDNFNRILQLSKMKKFPDESVIGVNENLENGFVFATLLHFPDSYSILKDFLWTSVQNGGTQPLSVLYVYGFNQSRISALYKQIITEDTINFKTCYNLPFGKVSDNIKEVNKARQQRKVLSVKTQDKLEVVAKKYQLDYKFGY